MEDLIEIKAKLLGSLLLFTQTFYKLRTGRDFVLSHPEGRESHFITNSRALTQVFRGEISNLSIHIAPRYGKTELLIHFYAWAMAHYPDCNFLYVSYSHSLAKKQTQTIKQIIELPQYKKIFGVEIAENTSAKDNFETTAGGSVYAAGAMGTITGRGAGIRNIERFGGCIGIDDIIKPAEAASDTIRDATNDWYYNTLLSRRNSPNTPIINIGQRTHENDLGSILLNDSTFTALILQSLDAANNALYPEMHKREDLLKMKEENPYVFAAQYQQDPQPAGGGIFKPEWFVLLDEDPDILATFITADTAETDKNYNDATVFSFWGLYKIQQFGMDTDLYGLHWIDCAELRIEPKDLHPEFMQFYFECCRYKVKPKLAVIEGKSTGATLLNIMKEIQGLEVIDVSRKELSPSRGFNNKTQRFLTCQPYVATKQISLPRYGKHTHMCIEHCRKITANESHRWDDIADTMADAIRVALVDEIVPRRTINTNLQDNIKAAQVMSQMNKINHLRNQQQWVR